MTTSPKEKSSPNARKVRIDDIVTVDPLTEKQSQAFQGWNRGDHLILAGAAGTGKTFLALYFALTQVLEKSNPESEVIIIRSIVPTRDIGFLPGTTEEKYEAYLAPYKGVLKDLTNFNYSHDDPYAKLVHQRVLTFESTSFLRGETFNDAVVIVDECQNMSFHELDTIATRLGRNCRIILSGDFEQSDLKSVKEAKGLGKFLDIMQLMNHVSKIDFTWEDVVRSGFVRDYLASKRYVEGHDDIKNEPKLQQVS